MTISRHVFRCGTVDDITQKKCHSRRAALGGAAYIAGVGASVLSQTNITNCTFQSNYANKSSFGVVHGGGGAMYLDGGVTLINGSTFKQNSATGFGGALAYIHKCFPSESGTWADAIYMSLQHFLTTCK